jgi:AcrR family transcriptional regulator
MAGCSAFVSGTTGQRPLPLGNYYRVDYTKKCCGSRCVSSVFVVLTMEREPMAKRGRPARFDRAEALACAMEVFWAHGFEGATLEDLQAAMGGISPPSFYHAFGSKEALFKEAVDLYVATVGGPGVRALREGKTAREGLEAMLRMTAEAVSRPGKAHGCILVLGATNCSPANRGAQEYLLDLRKQAPEVIGQRLQRAVAEGELATHLDIASIAAFYATVLHGLGIRAGDGAPRAALMASVEGAMAAWGPLTAAASSRPRGRRRARSHSAQKPKKAQVKQRRRTR